MIRINLLGKKKTAAVPFGLDDKLEKFGIKGEELRELQPAIVRIIVLGIGLYIGNYVPTYLHDEKLRKLDAELSKLTSRSGELARELATKKDIRKQMEQLNKEEFELNRQLNAVNALQQGRSLAFNSLNDLMIQLGKTGKVWLDDLKYESKKMSLNGRSWEFFPVNEFVKTITESTRYTNVAFHGIQSEASGVKPIAGVPEAMQKTKKFSLEYNVKEGE